MFDFSLAELMVVMVVALIVIGPERLPKVARTLGHLYGRAQRYVNGVKADIARDMAIVLIGVHPGGEVRRETSLASLLPDVFVFPK